MMVYEKSESARKNLGKFIYQHQPKTKKLVRKIERILMKLYWQNVYLLFDQICLNEGLLPKYPHTCARAYIYIYIYICVCVCVCVCAISQALPIKYEQFHAPV